MNNSSFKKGVLVIFSCFLLYAGLSFSSWNEPIMGDEVYALVSAKALYRPEMMSYFTTQYDLGHGTLRHLYILSLFWGNGWDLIRSR
jgi:hypothetical protein